MRPGPNTRDSDRVMVSDTYPRRECRACSCGWMRILVLPLQLRAHAHVALL